MSIEVGSAAWYLVMLLSGLWLGMVIAGAWHYLRRRRRS